MWWSSSSSSRSIRKERRDGGIVSCMSGMLQLFDFHLRGAIDCTGSSSSQVSAPSQSEDLALCCTAGIEAPRNSLEVLPAANSRLLPQLRNRPHQHGHGDEIDDIPMAFEIFARSESGRDWTYPDTRRKSRSVVARLMGLDILPDYAENGAGVRKGGGEGRRKNSVFANPVNDVSRGNGDVKLQRPKGTTKLKERNRDLRAVETTVRQEPLPSCSRSLPESPRISSARRSDVEHRLSLQIQKENIPPLVNLNYGDGCPLGSLLRASSSSAMNSETRKTSPRLVLSSNSPRVGKTREEKGQQRPSGTPPCSPRLKYRGDQESTTTTVAAAVASAPTTAISKPTLPRNKRTYPLQSTEPSSKANGPGSRFSNSINGKPKPEGSSLLREGSEPMARVQKKDRAPSPRIRESYVKVPDRSNGDAMKKGQRPICEQALLRAHSVISATKDSPRQLRTNPASGISPLSRSRRTAAAATSDLRQDASSVVKDHICNHLLHHNQHDKQQCTDPPPSSSSDPRTHDSPSSSSSSSLSSFLSSSVSTSATSTTSSASSSSSFIKAKDEAFFLIYPYIKAILELMGVRSNSKVSLLNWYSPSHPLDPAICTRLDAFHHCRHDDDDGGAMDGRMSNTRSNRKLIFHLVDELLRERLKLHRGISPWLTMTMKLPASWSLVKVATGRQLLEAVWADVRGFPSADCKIVHDVDVLVANDVLASHHSSPINDSTTEAFVEAILFQVGRDISDELVAEAVADFLPAPHSANPQDSCP